jgi:hypothetical protein
MKGGKESGLRRISNVCRDEGPVTSGVLGRPHLELAGRPQVTMKVRAQPNIFRFDQIAIPFTRENVPQIDGVAKPVRCVKF